MQIGFTKKISEKIKNAPKKPGVYIFYSLKNSLYVGKAANLKNRLKSYLKPADLKTQSLQEEATRLELVVLRSEIEALIEESRLIKELKPKYNILWRDDKSYFYVAFTHEKFPKILITHHSLNPKFYILNPRLIGPFTDGNALRLVMRLLRRYFPYCTCFKSHLRNCLNSQIGRCLGFCCKLNTNIRMNTNGTNNSFVDSSEIRNWGRLYAKNIRAIKAILRGQSKKLLKTLKNEKERRALEKIFEHKEFLGGEEQFLDDLKKIECYDISNLAGKEAVGAMTVLVKKFPPHRARLASRGGKVESVKENYEWVPDKSSYRKFKIKSAPTRDDPRMIAEILERRLNHPEWRYPDLIIIDGGIAQYRAAAKVLKKFKPQTANIKLLSFAKPKQKIIGIGNFDHFEQLEQLVKRAIYQTHNFVIRYHRLLRSKEFIKK